MTNSLEALEAKLLEIWPDSVIEVTEPLYPNGVWSLTMDCRNKFFCVEWHPEGKFALTDCEDHTYGLGTDFVTEQPEMVTQQISLALSGFDLRHPLNTA